MTCPKCGFDGSEIAEKRPFVDSDNVIDVELRHFQDEHPGEKVSIFGKIPELAEEDKLSKKYSAEFDSEQEFLNWYKRNRLAEEDGDFIKQFAETTGFEEVMG